MSKCNRDCFHCPYDDCILDDDDLTEEELALADELDREIAVENFIDRNAVIRTGRRGRPRKVFPAKETEEYGEKQKEYQRRYYQEHREERIAWQKEYSKDYYKAHADVYKARAVKRYREKYRNDPEFREKERKRHQEYYRRKKKAIQQRKERTKQ